MSGAHLNASPCHVTLSPMAFDHAIFVTVLAKDHPFSNLGGVAQDNLQMMEQTMTESDSLRNASAHIAIVQALYTAFGRRDINGILALLASDVEWGEPENPYNPAGGTRRGHAGFLEWIQIGRNAEDILVLEPRKFLVDEDSVAVVGYMKCLAKPTGRTYESDFVHVATLKDGKVKKFQEFFDTYVAGEAFRSTER